MLVKGATGRWSHLTLGGRVTHIHVSNLTIIGWDNGLLPGRRQATISTNAGILIIGHLGTNFNEILIKIHTFSFKNIHFKMSSGKWRPFRRGFNVFHAAVTNRPNATFSQRFHSALERVQTLGITTIIFKYWIRDNFSHWNTVQLYFQMK